ncbi:Tetratricopeptide repeat-containing domain protein [Pyrenophora tritici-repentis]|nr:Tetratricopeptide repeat-containing domain protein [Pyrenophora tritici-repentis]
MLKASAVIPAATGTEPFLIHADHIITAKFASKEDNGYRTVSGHLQLMVESLGEAIAMNCLW